MLAMTLSGKEAQEVKDIAKVLKNINQTGSPIIMGGGGGGGGQTVDLKPLEGKVSTMERKLDYALARFGNESLLDPSAFEIQRMLHEISQGGWLHKMAQRAQSQGQAFGPGTLRTFIKDVTGAPAQKSGSQDLLQEADEALIQLTRLTDITTTPKRKAKFYAALAALRERPLAQNLIDLRWTGTTEPELSKYHARGGKQGLGGAYLIDQMKGMHGLRATKKANDWFTSLDPMEVAYLDPEQKKQLAEFSGTRKEADKLIDDLLYQQGYKYLPRVLYPKVIHEAYTATIGKDAEHYDRRQPDWMAGTGPGTTKEIKSAKNADDVYDALSKVLPKMDKETVKWFSEKVWNVTKGADYGGIFMVPFKRGMTQDAIDKGEMQLGDMPGVVSEINSVRTSRKLPPVKAPTGDNMLESIGNIAQFLTAFKDDVINAVQAAGGDVSKLDVSIAELIRQFGGFSTKPQQSGGGVGPP